VALAVLTGRATMINWAKKPSENEVGIYISSNLTIVYVSYYDNAYYVVIDHKVVFHFKSISKLENWLEEVIPEKIKVNV